MYALTFTILGGKYLKLNKDIHGIDRAYKFIINAIFWQIIREWFPQLSTIIFVTQNPVISNNLNQTLDLVKT